MSSTTNTLADDVSLPPLAGAELVDEVDEYFEAGARVAPGDVVVDVGANVGAFAMRAAERASGRLTIHCFEPAPSTFDKLRANLAAHAALRGATVSTWPLALTCAEGAGKERAFYHFAHSPTNSTYDLDDKRAEHEAYFAGKARRIEAAAGALIPWIGAWLGWLLRVLIERATRRTNGLAVWIGDRSNGLRVVSCRTESLERWAEAQGIERIDLLKVDVEGAELDVLRGCGSKWPLVRSVAVEAHARGGRDESILSLLREQGFRTIVRFRPRITERTGLDNVLFVAHREERAGLAVADLGTGGAS